jgi:transposase
MAIIPQINLFSWENDIEILGDLERLVLVMETLPDEELMRRLERKRGNGRDDYPVRAMWNSLLAGIIFQHASIESMGRELNRNGQMRLKCGFETNKIPRAHNYSRFLENLMEEQGLIDKMFSDLVEELRVILPGFGKRLAMDSKFIDSFANRKNKNEEEDGRRDTDADIGIKKYYGTNEDGSTWEKIVKCFGYKLHLIVEAMYELPVAYEVTRASSSDVVEGHKLVDKLKKGNKEIVEACKLMTADKGYDDTKLIEKLKGEEFGIKAVIDTRRMWQDEKERQIPGYQNAYYDESGNAYCYCPASGTKRTMTCNGYESSRDCIRKQCPAKAYGLNCEGMESCPCKSGLRISLSLNPRVFTEVDRSSYKWEREYKHRTAVERVNSRLDVSFGFENHTIRGMKKMRMRSSLALIIMLAMALGRIRQKKPELMRSLVRSA